MMTNLNFEVKYPFKQLPSKINVFLLFALVFRDKNGQIAGKHVSDDSLIEFPPS